MTGLKEDLLFLFGAFRKNNKQYDVEVYKRKVNFMTIKSLLITK